MAPPRPQLPLSPSPGGDNDVQRVKDACDIVRIVGEHVALRPKGREFVGLCPFHDDKTPSLNVVPSKQFYKCFSCGAAGDVLTFVRNFLRMEFREALEYLAQRGGVTLAPRGRRDAGEGGEGPGVSKRDVIRACEAACVLFEELLRDGLRGKSARDVIARRGISAAMQEEFRLGASVEGWDTLVTRLSRTGMTQATMLAAGLVKQKEGSASVYDAFRDRVMFPICDKAGQVVAFGARKIKDADEPKYLNSAETIAFHKSATLYAQHLASRAMQETRTALICEGYTDVIACHQSGFRNAVATLGTALTTQHARALRLVCDRVVLLFDGDQAGQRATDRAAEVFFAEPLDVHVVSLAAHTDAKDPDELLKREGGCDVFKKALDTAPDLLEYRFARVRAGLARTSMAAREKLLREEIEKLVALGLGKGTPIREALIRRRLADVSGLSEATIRAVIPAGRDGPNRAPQARNAADAPAETDTENRMKDAALLASRPLTVQEHILGCLLCEGDLWAGLSGVDKDRIAPMLFDPSVRDVAEIVHALGEDGEATTLRNVLGKNPEVPVQEAAIQLMSRVFAECMQDPVRIESHARENWRRLGLNEFIGQSGRSMAEPKPLGLHSTGEAESQRRVDQILDAHKKLGPNMRHVPRPS